MALRGRLKKMLSLSPCIDRATRFSCLEMRKFCSFRCRDAERILQGSVLAVCMLAGLANSYTPAGLLAITIYVPYAEYVTSFLEEAPAQLEIVGGTGNQASSIKCCELTLAPPLLRHIVPRKVWLPKLVELGLGFTAPLPHEGRKIPSGLHDGPAWIPAPRQLELYGLALKEGAEDLP